MTEVTETQLPGVGVRYEFTTGDGERVGVLYHHSGRREVVVYDRADPDVGRTVMHLTSDDSRTLTELLGATQVSEAIGAMQQRIEGLALEWIEIEPDSEQAGHTIGEGELRTRTGASVVAVIRGSTTEPAPAPDFTMQAGDVVVAVGTPENLEKLRGTLRA